MSEELRGFVWPDIKQRNSFSFSNITFSTVLNELLLQIKVILWKQYEVKR